MELAIKRGGSKGRKRSRKSKLNRVPSGFHAKHGYGKLKVASV